MPWPNLARMAADTGAAYLACMFACLNDGSWCLNSKLAADAHFGVGLDGIGLEDSEEHRQGSTLRHCGSLYSSSALSNNLVPAGVLAGKRTILVTRA